MFPSRCGREAGGCAAASYEATPLLQGRSCSPCHFSLRVAYLYIYISRGVVVPPLAPLYQRPCRILRRSQMCCLATGARRNPTTGSNPTGHPSITSDLWSTSTVCSCWSSVSSVSVLNSPYRDVCRGSK
jgi:hypothetical protein